MEQSERGLLDTALEASGLGSVSRTNAWLAADRILAHGPLADTGETGSTGLALGYVQSGKTTAITALIAAAADQGYRIIVALLGSTNLLLQQNQDRLSAALGVSDRTDYRWILMTNPTGVAASKEISDWLARDRVVLVPVLKHSGRIAALAQVIRRVTEQTPVPILIVDDEADQASLNTQVSKAGESRVYEAVTALRRSAPSHLYVQFTATPYAPLLLESGDHLRPDFVELLQPGPGYTGGREFFVDNANVVVRPIPTLDEQRPKSLPTLLPRSLTAAVGSFIAGSALLLGRDEHAAPVSMLVHSTQRNDVQARYHFLLSRLLQRWREQAAGAGDPESLPVEISEERNRIVELGADNLGDEQFLDRVRYVLRESTLWLVNSASDVSKVDWNVAPIHILVGGNKLDRGFTVEGLTVTYMNRPASEQLDTIEQRARAFGYRSDLLPYCQFFATPRTVKILREIVDTEYDLRAQLRDWLAAGHDVADWASQVGLLLPEGTRPTRQSVLTALSRFNDTPTWHQLRRPSLSDDDRASNSALVSGLNIDQAPLVDYGRLSHRTLNLPLADVLSDLLDPWAGTPDGHSPGWRHDDLLDLLRRLPQQDHTIPVILMEHPDGGPRTRDWDSELGFVNLMQGRDQRTKANATYYPGDRAIGGVSADPEQVVVQIHHVQSTQSGVVPALYSLAIHAGRRHVVRKGTS